MADLLCHRIVGCRAHKYFDCGFVMCTARMQHNNVCMYVCMYGDTYSKSMDQPGKVAIPARGQLSRENECFPVRVRA